MSNSVAGSVVGPVVGKFQNFVELLQYRAVHQAAHIAFRFLPDGDVTDSAPTLTFAELDERARAIAASLLQRCEPGDRALLIYPSGLDFVAAFFGCLYAGIIAVPAYPPKRNQKLQRLQTLVEDCAAAIALTESQSYDIAFPQFSAVAELKNLPWLCTDSELSAGAEDYMAAVTDSADIAFLQYTSGSTGNPKGVMVSHGNLIANSELIYTAMSHSDETVFVGWAPLFHDMGLIGNVLQPVFAGISCTLLPPAAFLQKPLRWLQAISKYRATTSGGPNFAYDLCVNTVKDEDLASLDLSSWQVAFNGAEPIRAESMQAFSRRFQASGFRDSAHYPCYGMAETTLLVTGIRVGQGNYTRHFETAALQEGRAAVLDSDSEDSSEWVNCGQSWCEHRVEIVDPETGRACVDNQVGEIWISGGSVARGYWQKPEATADTFAAEIIDGQQGPFLRTGDLGFLDKGELFVTGRLKDVLIIRGLNHYPQDIELTAFESHQALMPNGAAAFTVARNGIEQLVIVLEVKRTYLRKLDANDVVMTIQQAVTQQHELQAHSIVLIKPGRLPKTSSGKVQRQGCKQLYLHDGIEAIARIEKAAIVEAAALPRLVQEDWQQADDSHKQAILTDYLLKLFACFAQLEQDQLALDKPFMGYGLDSLALTQISAQLSEALGLELSVEQLFSVETLAGLIDRLLHLDKSACEQGLVREAITPAVSETGSYPLSYAQQRMWFLSEYDNSSLYNISGLIDIEGELDSAILAQCFKKIIERHESLRTRFVVEGDQIRQQIQPQLDWALSVVDVSDRAADEVAVLIDDQMLRLFDLATDTLLRASLYKIAEHRYRLALSLHHIIADGWSVSLLMRELSSLYGALVEQRQIPLTPLKLHYKDYAAWQQDYLQTGHEGGSSILQRQSAYWREQLAGAAPLALPLDRVRPALACYRGQRVAFGLGQPLTQQLKQLSRESGVTLYMTLLAAFTSLLHKYAGQDDISVGSPIAGRNRNETRELIGLFVNTLVMRSDLSTNPSFSELLQQVKNTALQAYANQDMPFEKIVDALELPRDAAISPLFQVMFALQDRASLEVDISGLKTSDIQAYSQTSKFDLTLEMVDSSQGLIGHFEYKTALFDTATIESFSRYFRQLLEAVVAAPESPLSELNMLAAADIEQQLQGWNDTAVAHETASLHGLFEQQAQYSPQALAAIVDGDSPGSDLISERSSISYQQLDRRANQLAHYLRAQGIARNSVVGLCVERSVDMLIGMLGILKAGAGYLPLDPSYPSERLVYMLEQSRASMLLLQDHLQPLFINESQADGSLPRLRLDADAAQLADLAVEAPEVQVSDSDLAYVIYTSGSTGRPKGVAISHGAICNQMQWLLKQFPLTAQDRLLHKTPFSFDASVWEIWAPLLSECQLWMAKPGGHKDLNYLLQLMLEQGITTVQMVPSLLQAMLALPAIDKLTQLKRLFLGGEALSTDLARHALGLAPSVVNLYGPTECTINASFLELEADALAASSATDDVNLSHKAYVSIGRPIDNLQSYLLGRRGELLPVGAVAELYIGGAGLSSGYLHQPQLTAERFIDNPFCDSAVNKLYRTGDLVRYLADGQLEFLGRIDEQIKLRGLRIELGEIESVLQQCPQVSECAVAVKTDPQANDRLVAYYLPEPALATDDLSASSERELQQALSTELAKHLADYMIPGLFMRLQTLPRNQSGKLDRRALPEPDYREQVEYVAPQSETEKLLVRLWQSLLDAQLVGRVSNFFNLGGHSLLAARLALQVRREFGVNLAIAAIFEQQTLAQLAAEIDRLQDTAATAVALTVEQQLSDQQLSLADQEITAAPQDSPFALSFSQQRLWLLNQMQPNSAQYNMPAVIHLHGSLDIQALTSALNEILLRHQVLHSVYRQQEGQIYQQPLQQPALGIALEDLTAGNDLSEDEKNAQIASLIDAEALKPFDLSRDLMMRAQLIKQAEQQFLLLITLHHIASDGWSTGILISELNHCYNAEVEAKPSNLLALDCQYVDYAHWQRNQLTDQALAPSLKFWKQSLTGLPAVHSLPLDRPRPAQASYRGATHRLTLSAQLSADIQRLAAENDASLFMLLHAALAAFIYRYSGQDDIAIGTPVANRTPAAVEPLIGLFVNTLVLRSDLSDPGSFKQLIGQSRQFALAAYDAAQLPFEKLVDALQPERSLSYNPLFQIMLVMQNNAQVALDFAGGIQARLEESQTQTKFDLTLNVCEGEQGISIAWEYATDIFDDETIAEMADNFEVLLSGMVSESDQPLTRLSLLTEQQQEYLQTLNAGPTLVDSPLDLCIQQLFEQQVDAHPDNLALVYQGQSVTYHQLNERANQLAHYLLSEVGPVSLNKGELIGLCSERSVDMIVAMLAILKAGCAYVPVDPSYPKGRIEHILQDSGVQLVLTQSPLLEQVDFNDRLTLCLDSQSLIDDLALFSAENIPPARLSLTADDLAYVIYTSGSTGKPKGSLLLHSGLCNLARAQQQAFGVQSHSRVIQFASIAFDAATWEVFMALSSGAALHLLPKTLVQSADALSAYVATEKISHATLPPALLPVLDIDAWDSVQDLVVAGEHCPLGLAKLWARGRHFYNAYGPSETTVCASIGQITADAELVHMGKPMAGVQLYVLDDALQTLPIGAAGQLYVGGCGVGRGYLNRPQLNSEKFIANPFGEGRLYATGDLVRWLRDGNLEFLGRIDQQVKIRGFRVELGEIETILSQQSAIEECAVLAVADKSGSQQLVAYFIAEDQSCSSEDLREALAESLPEYMLPSFFVALEAFPLTVNGKLDKRALPQPELAQQSTTSYVAASNDTEQQLIDIWQSLLQLDDIGIKHNFFEIGGHSLLAIQVISRIREALGVQLKVTDLFVHPRIESLATRVAALAEDTSASQLPSIEPRAVGSQVPLSFEQQAYWFLYQLEEGSSTYNTPAALRLSGDLNIGALSRGLQTIVQRHESLRTLFTLVDGQAMQTIVPVEQCEFCLEQVYSADFSQRKALVLQVQADADYVFDLEKQLPIRARLLKINSQEHVFTLVMHHTVADGWSMDVFIRELVSLYQAYAQTDEGREQSPLAPLPIQFGDYAVWQRSNKQALVYQRQLDYWVDNLKGLPPLLNLPADYPRPPVQSYRGSEVRFIFPLQLTQSLNNYAREQATTLFNTLLAGLSILLSRYGRTQDVAVGTAVANRPQTELESLIGCFANTLVIRSQVDSQLNFHEFTQQVSQQAFAAYEHAGVPFDSVVEAVKPERSLGVPPIFQVMFRLHNHRTGQGLEFPGLTTESLHFEANSAKLDLNFSLLESDGCLEGIIEYATDLFSEQTVLRIAKHYQILLEAAMADLQAPIAELPILSRDESQQVRAWNDTRVDYPQDECIHHLVEQTAVRLPAKLAYVCGDEAFTYQSLNEKANRLAHFLMSRGIGPEQCVGMSVQRSSWSGICILATFKAGGVYTPLDANYPQARLDHMLAVAQPKIILTLSSLKHRYKESAAEIICLDEDWPLIESQSTLNPAAIGADHSAYILFTSGSTGKPKGILVSHRSFRNMAVSQQQLQLLDQDSRVLQFASLSFSIAFWGTFMAWVPGGTLYSVSEEQSLPGEPLYQLLENQQISHVTWPVSLLSTIDIERMPLSLQTIISSAEPCTDAVVERWTRRGCRFLNLYGNSEVSLGSTFYEYHRVGQKLTIGKPLPNTQMYLLDENLQQVPIGVIAEIHTAGVGLARGYVNNPEETDRHFIGSRVIDSLLAEQNLLGCQSPRLYKTGDLGRYLANGEIEFIGREDFQVSVRGFRVELTEIENLLRALPEIAEVAVVSRDDSVGVARLICFYVLEPDGGQESGQDSALNSGYLRSQLAEKLPSYMLPNLFVCLESMPLTPNRKIDRQGLPMPSSELAETEAYVAPEGELAVALAAIWAEVLELERISATDSFFELGGHSLLVVQMVARVKQSMGLALSVKDIFTHNNIAALSNLLAERGTGERGELQALPPVQARKDLASVAPEDHLPLSLEQAPYWFLYQLEGGSATYNVPLAMRLQGTLDTAALESAFRTLIERHEILRTTFVSVEAKPVQRVLSQWDFQLPVIALHSSGYDEPLTDQLKADAGYVFDLAAELPLRARLFSIDSNHHVVTLVVHHTVIDGWSLDILVRELAKLYTAYRSDSCGDTERASNIESAAELSPMSVQYADYALWQQQHIVGPRYDEQIDYWRNKLAGLAPVLNLPSDYSRPAVQSYRGAEQPLKLSFALSTQLKQFALHHNTTLFNLLLAGLAVVLSRYGRTQDVPIGTAIANRNQTEVESLIGCFANTLVLRCDVDANLSFAELAQQLGNTSLEAFENADVPFDGVVEALQPERNLGIAPIFQVMFRLHSQKMGVGVEFSGLSQELISIESTSAKLDVNFSLAESEQGISGVIEYATDLFSQQTIERMGKHYCAILEAAMAEQHSSVGQLNMLSSEEIVQVEQWNHTAVDYPQDECMHHLFERSVAKTPNKLAYVCGDDQFTYTELNLRANRLAHYLQACGVGPQVSVGVSVERSTWAGIAALASFKSGGTYVPLDANYPRERLAHMLAVAKPKVILTLSSLADRYSDSDALIVCLDSQWDNIKSQPVTNPPALGASHSAYILFTSGTTGKPKGILVSHHSFRNLAVSQAAFELLDADNRVLQFASLSFSIALWGSFMAWVPGGTLYSVTEEEALPGEPLYRLLERQQITHVTWPVSLLSTINIERIPHSLTTVISSAEPCHDAVVARWTQRGCRFLNMYGNSEVSLGSTMYEYQQLGQKLTIGRALPNTRMYLLDEQLRQVPIGVIAEICTAGVGLATGYIDNPVAMAASFVPSPFSDDPSERLYKTGDLGRYLPNGEIEFIGREDFQVSIRGFRVELVEIEDALREIDGMAEVVVISREDDNGLARLVCFYVLTASESDTSNGAVNQPMTGQSAISQKQLRETLEQKLPAYMVPSLFVRLDAMPLTPNRKIDRTALPSTGAEVLLEDDFIAPRNEIESLLADIWGEILGREKIGVSQNFFELGGHSLLATQVISQIKTRLAVDIALQTLFKQPTIEALAKHVEQADGSYVDQPIECADRQRDIPLSFAQERLWFLDRYEENSNFYHMPSILRLRGDLCVASLQRAFSTIIERHEALRTNFISRDGGALQKISTPEDYAWRFDCVDLEQQADAEQLADELIAKELQRPFDLQEDALIRTKLLRLSATEHRLFVNMHHIVSDGWSISVLIEEMQSLYRAYSRGESTPLAPLAIQYPDFSVWQREYLQGSRLQQQSHYWREQLADLNTLQLPLDFVRPENQTYKGDRLYFNLDAELTERLNRLSSQSGSTLFMTLLAAFTVLLQRHSGQTDICIGTPIANRVRAEIEPLIGFFANTLVLRSDLAGDPSFAELLERVSDTTLAAHQHQDIPFEKVVDLVLPQRDPSRSPLFQVSFALQKLPAMQRELAGLQIEPIETENKTAKFDLLLEVMDQSEGLEAYFEYNTDLFAPATISAYQQQFMALLHSILTDVNRPLSQLSLLDVNVGQRSVSSQWQPLQASSPAYPLLEQLLHTLAPRGAAQLGELADNWHYALVDGCYQTVPVGTVGRLMLRPADATVEIPLSPEVNVTDGAGRGFIDSSIGRLFDTGLPARSGAAGLNLLPADDRLALVEGCLVYPEQLAQTLLQSPELMDCYVAVEQHCSLGPQLLVYGVFTGLANQAQVNHGLVDLTETESGLNSRLRAGLGESPTGAVVPYAYVPVTHIPRLRQGAVDSRALASLMVISGPVRNLWQQRLSALDGIQQAHVSWRLQSPQTAPLHIEDFLRADSSVQRDSARVDRESAAGLPGDAVIDDFSDQRRVHNDSLSSDLAISLGGELQQAVAGEVVESEQNLARILCRTAAQQADKQLLFYYADGAETAITYRDLLSQAQAVQTGLLQLGLKPRHKVIFQFDRNQDFVVAFWACMLAGFIPVPIGAGRDYSKSCSHTTKVAHAHSLMDHAIVLTSDSLLAGVQNIATLENIPALRVASISSMYDLPPTAIEAAMGTNAASDDVALIMLTSGSTGLPKGVQLSHKNMISRTRGSIQRNGFSSEQTSLNWMALDHVGGIIYFHIRDVYLGAQQLQVDTDYVLADPLRWLNLISRHRVNVTWAPNFAFALILDNAEALVSQQQVGQQQSNQQQTNQQAASECLDLSCMHFMLNGAEAVVPKTTQAFIELLTPLGLPDNAVKPVYGMSELSSGITYPERLQLTYSGDDNVFVTVGKPIPGVNLRIVDEQDQLLREGQSGRLQVSGLTVTQGYLGGAQVNDGTFTDDGWFKTGDLAFLEQGALTITGREKDIIIINGANFYSHEIESVVEELEAVNVSYTAACAVQCGTEAGDQLAVFFNTDLLDNDQLLDLIRQIRRVLTSRIGVTPAYVLPLNKEQIPKTEIGKIQLAKLSQSFKKGDFDSLIKRLDLLEGNDKTLPNWFYQRTWQAKPLPLAVIDVAVDVVVDAVIDGLVDVKAPNPSLLVLADRTGLAGCLNSGSSSPIEVIQGARYLQLSDYKYQVNPARPEHYRRLVNDLVERQVAVSGVVNLWGYNLEDEYLTPAGDLANLSQADACQTGIYSLYGLAQAFAEADAQISQESAAGEQPQVAIKKSAQTAVMPRDWLYVSRQAQQLQSEDSLCPEKSLVIPALAAFAKEQSQLRCRHLDFAGEKTSLHGQQLLRELEFGDSETEVSYRQEQRFVSRLQHAIADSAGDRSSTLYAQKPGTESIRLEHNQAYLIAGGLGGIAYELASHLLKDYGSKLLLVGRSALESLAEDKQKLLQRLQKLGNVSYQCADICDQAQLQAAVDVAERHWGQKLKGVFQLAGLADDQPLVEQSLETLQKLLLPKVQGTKHLYDIANQRTDSLFVCFSSVNSHFPAAGMAAYAAANRYQVSFVEAVAGNKNVRSVCLGWSMWQDTGMGKKYAHLQGASKAMGFESINARQGMSCLQLCLAQGLDNVLIGLNSTKANIYQTLSDVPVALQQALYCVATTEPLVAERLIGELKLQDEFGRAVQARVICRNQLPLTQSQIVDEQALLQDLLGHQQPAEEKVAPRNEIEATLIRLATEAFDVTQPIGVKDNFFDVGANSLLIVKFHHEIQEQLSVQLPLVELFNSTTVEKLANFLSARQKPSEVADKARSVAEDRKAAMQRRRRGRTNRRR